MKSVFLAGALLALAGGAAAQSLPSEPVTVGGGRVVVSGDFAASTAPEDRGYFNYTDYENSVLRLVRFGASASVRASDRISFLGELRTENFGRVLPFALYARVRPFPNRRFDIQIGRIPPTFGSFTRRTYSHDNPLIGYPLAYQYLTSLRADAVPATPDELLRMRGRGWLARYSVGNAEEARGLPLVTSFNWDTGVQITTGWENVTVTGAVTNGSLSNPRVSDDNGGKQVALRLASTPLAGLVVGTSFARGQFLSRRVLNVVADGNGSRYVQRAHGVDAEYSRDHWLVRADAVFSQWQLPLAAEPLSHGRLQAIATSLEGKYTVFPGAYAAARAEHLAFSRIAGTTRTLAWDAPVTRLEVGGGYYLQRNVIVRMSLQHNAREAGRVQRSNLLAAQLLYWF